jgi:putative flippase GtrA
MIDGKPPVGQPSMMKHGAGFIASGLLATATDAATLVLLTRAAGLDPFSARIIAIACAMVAGFFAHRRLTFAVREPATAKQFTAFVGVAATAATINYAMYAGILLLWPQTEPLLAMLAPTLIAMAVSYTGLRFGVFRKPGNPPPAPRP